MGKLRDALATRKAVPSPKPAEPPPVAPSPPPAPAKPKPAKAVKPKGPGKVPADPNSKTSLRKQFPHGRLPAGSRFECDWNGERWTCRLSVPGREEPFVSQWHGSLHACQSKADLQYRMWVVKNAAKLEGGAS